MGLAEVKADAKLLRERLISIDSAKLDVRLELADNIVPLFEGLVEALQEGLEAEVEGLEAEVADLGEAFDELISGEKIHAETAGKIVGVLEIGKLLANELDAVLAKFDDVGKKRVRALVKAYRQGAEVIGEIITEITMPVDDEDEEDGDPGDKSNTDDNEEDEDEDKIVAEVEV